MHIDAEKKMNVMININVLLSFSSILFTSFLFLVHCFDFMLFYERARE